MGNAITTMCVAAIVLAIPVIAYVAVKECCTQPKCEYTKLIKKRGK